MVPSIKMRRLSRRIRVRRVCYALIYYAVFAVSVFGYAERNGIDLLAALHNWKRIVLFVVLFLLPLLVFRVVNMIWDRDYDGVIVSRRVQRRYLMDFGRRRARPVEAEIFKVKRDDGKKAEFEFVGKQLKYSHYFNVGDRVHHYAALPFPEKADKSADTVKFCLKCGSTHFPEQSRCYFCGKPLPEASDEPAPEKKKMSFHDIFG